MNGSSYPTSGGAYGGGSQYPDYNKKPLIRKDVDIRNRNTTTVVNTNNITATNNVRQTATSGNVTVSKNTSVGNVSSGDATNYSETTTSIQINN